ncbi:MAG: hypothetical protein U0U66_01520 [Cytophagaceae bacterium]
MKSHIIRPTEVDKKKWDDLLKQDRKADVFLFSHWLDIVFPTWELIVNESFTAAIPVFRKKIGKYYSFDLPNFIQALSIIGEDINDAIAKQVVELLGTTAFVCVPYITSLPASKNISNTTRRHQILELTPEVRFPTKVWGRNIRKAEAYQAESILDVPVDDFLLELKKEMKAKGNPYRAKDFLLLKELIQSSIREGYGVIKGVKDKDSNWACGQFYIYHSSGMYLVNCFTSGVGREHSILHYLLYCEIEMLSKGKEYFKIHFGGSNIQAIADFNKNFGATDEYYQLYQHNRLPWYLKWIK